MMLTIFIRILTDQSESKAFLKTNKYTRNKFNIYLIHFWKKFDKLELYILAQKTTVLQKVLNKNARFK